MNKARPSPVQSAAAWPAIVGPIFAATLLEHHPPYLFDLQWDFLIGCIPCSPNDSVRKPTSAISAKSRSHRLNSKHPHASRVTPVVSHCATSNSSYQAPLYVRKKVSVSCWAQRPFVALASGCKKSEPGNKRPAANLPKHRTQPFTNSAPGELIARIHWLGKKRLASDIMLLPSWDLEHARIEKLEKQTSLQKGSNLGRIAANAS